MDQVVQAFTTGAGMLWKALWALIFGYIISAGIQVLVTREQMAKILGERGPKEAAIAGLFGFISSSCSFAALAASRSVLVKGAHPMNSRVPDRIDQSGDRARHRSLGTAGLEVHPRELSSWHADDRLRLHSHRALVPVDQAKEHAEKAQQSEGMDMEHGMKGSFRAKLLSRNGWRRIAKAFFMEWKMVWKEILFGFTIAGLISVFVPQRFWNAIFLIGDGGAQQSPSLLTVLENALVAPVVAFFTFIGSMGNVPLAAMLWSRDASFGGVVAFLGADLVAATAIWVHAKYYGWRYAFYLSGLLYVCMVAAGTTVHYLFALVGMIPTERPSLQEMVRFAIDYTFFLNLAFLAAAAALLWLHFRGGGESRGRRNQQEHEATRARA